MPAMPADTLARHQAAAELADMQQVHAVQGVRCYEAIDMADYDPTTRQYGTKRYEQARP